MASTADLQSYARLAAQKNGVPENLFIWQIGAESSWNVNAKNPLPGSTSSGLGGFIDSTAKSRGLDKSDPYATLDHAAAYMAELKQKTGSWPSALDAYGTTKGNPTKQAQAAEILAGESGETKERSWLDAFSAGFSRGYGETPEDEASASGEDTSLAGGIKKWVGSIGFILLGIVFVVLALMMTDTGKAITKKAVTKGLA